MRQYQNAAAYLAQRMQQRALMPSELARRTGIDRGILRRILDGRERAISTRNMLALARFFGMPLQELVDRLS